MEVSGFMIDMDGTIYKGGDMIPGAKDFIERLKKKGIPFVFLTNNSSRSRSYYLDKLHRMGFDVTLDNVLTSNTATIRYILENHPGKSIFPLAVPDVIDEIVNAGIEISYDVPDIVYLTFDKSITYQKLNDAYHHILRGAILIATHPDDLCPTEDSYDVDIGPFIRLFESISGCKADVIGKPNPLMLRMAASEMGVDPNGTVMVGDRLYTDMRMACDTGIRSILVMSGETSYDDLAKSSIEPTFVLGSVAEIPELLDKDV